MSRCSICDPNYRVCVDTGPEPCSIWLCGEKPGQLEDLQGRPLVGKTGQELNGLYLPKAGLRRDEVRCSNVLKCRIGGTNDAPTDDQIRHCAMHHIPGEVERCQPEIIVLMGATACKLVPKLEVEKDHGLPIWCGKDDSEFFGGWEGYVWPMYHPAAGLHNTSLMIPLIEDWTHLGQWRKGDGSWEWEPKAYAPIRPYRAIEERSDLIRTYEETVLYEWVAVDTENDGPRPWSLQFSGSPGTGYLIKADRPDLLALFAEMAREQSWWMHNATHDLDILERLRLPQPLRFEDTMQQSYALGNLPRGLKALLWRLKGIKMRSWEDLVGPPSRRKMVGWLGDAWSLLSDDQTREDTLYVRPRPATPQELKDPDGEGVILGREMLDLPMILGSRNKAGAINILNPRKAKFGEWADPVKRAKYVFEGEPRRTREVLGRFEWKLSKPEKDVKRILSHSHKPTYDLFEKAEEAGLAGVGDPADRLRGEVGKSPIMSIVNADPADSIVYACQDSDLTGQLGLELRRIREERMKMWEETIEEGDRV